MEKKTAKRRPIFGIEFPLYPTLLVESSSWVVVVRSSSVCQIEDDGEGENDQVGRCRNLLPVLVIVVGLLVGKAIEGRRNDYDHEDEG